MLALDFIAPETAEHLVETILKTSLASRQIKHAKMVCSTNILSTMYGRRHCLCCVQNSTLSSIVLLLSLHFLYRHLCAPYANVTRASSLSWPEFHKQHSNHHHRVGRWRWWRRGRRCGGRRRSGESHNRGLTAQKWQPVSNWSVLIFLGSGPNISAELWHVDNSVRRTSVGRFFVE